MSLSSTTPALTLFSLPTSNYAMRNRFVIARKGIPIEIVSLSSLADTKSSQFLAISPHGKVPALVIDDETASGPTCIVESNSINTYLIDRFESTGPNFLPETAERRALASMVTHVLDNYVSPFHSYMYKPMDAVVDRGVKVAEKCKGFDILDSILDADGPYVAGSSLSIGDAALFGK
jgi:glutathione S-transferase